MTNLLDAPPQKSGAAPTIAIFGTAVAHGVIVLLASMLGVRGVSELKKLLPVTEMVEVQLPEAPAPEHVAAAPQPLPVRLKAPSPSPAEPPPTAAQAGQVLDAKRDVVDFGDSFVTGSGSEFAGGVTDSHGTSTAAVRDLAAQGSGAGQAKPTVATVPADLSRPPQLAGGAQWQCPFPAEADDAAVDHAVVTLKVDVATDGSVRAVSVLTDPGNGFGREARRCANSKRWQSGLDRLGHPVEAHATVNVRFDRQ